MDGTLLGWTTHGDSAMFPNSTLAGARVSPRGSVPRRAPRLGVMRSPRAELWWQIIEEQVVAGAEGHPGGED